MSEIPVSIHHNSHNIYRAYIGVIFIDTVKSDVDTTLVIFQAVVPL